jgi:arylformamidase
MNPARAEIVDLTMPISDGMDAFPGEPTARFTRFSTIDDGGIEMWDVDLFSQLGTHVDAPSHFIAGGVTVDALPLANGIGPAVVVDLAVDEPITAASLGGHEERVRAAQRVVLRTGWDVHLGTPSYWAGSPELSVEAAELLVSWKVTFLGLDVPTPSHSDLHRVHQVLLSAGVVIAECLVNTAALADDFTIVCLPLPLVGMDGSPARIVALQEGARR